MSNNADEPKLMTAEQFRVCEILPEYCELVKGEVVPVNRPSTRHGQVCSELVFVLRTFCEEHACGHVVCNDSGIIVNRSPDTVRGPDIAYYSYQRVAQGPPPDEYFATPPNVVFEVLSKSDQWSKLLIKIGEYLSTDVKVVCIIDPEQQTARLFRSDKTDLTFTDDETLVIPELHPDLAINVREIFG